MPRIHRERLESPQAVADTVITDAANPKENIMSSTSFKAFAFGLGATVALTLSITHHQAQQDRLASAIQLETVYITGKRADGLEVKQLPTVYITGSRSKRASGAVVAAAQVACTTQLC
ncbi:hypothetical protein CDN98_15945 [Roseateles terrae]|nr:hypothetical protein CDN98_15945 [Roseateles terrae]